MLITDGKSDGAATRTTKVRHSDGKTDGHQWNFEFRTEIPTQNVLTRIGFQYMIQLTQLLFTWAIMPSVK